MQAPDEEEIPALGIVFDADIGNNIDDVLALGLLYGFDSKKPVEARLLSVSITKSNIKAAQFCEAVERFYTQITNRSFPERFRRSNASPVGLALDGKMAADTPLLTEPLSKRDAEDKPLYPQSIEKITDTADAAALIRNSLTAQYDHNASVVLTGPATNLAQVLGLHGAKEIIKDKVRLLTVAVGDYPDGPPEEAIVTDIAAAKKLFAEWPTQIIAVGPDIGKQLLYPAAASRTISAGPRCIPSWTPIARSGRCPTTRPPPPWPPRSTPCGPTRVTFRPPSPAPSPCSTTAARALRRPPTASIAT